MDRPEMQKINYKDGCHLVKRGGAKDTKAAKCDAYPLILDLTRFPIRCTHRFCSSLLAASNSSSLAA